MLEEATSVAGCDSIKRPAHRFDQSLAGACLKLPQRPFHFGEGLLDGIEIRRVGRQVEKVAASLLDHLAYSFAVVRGGVVKWFLTKYT